MGIIFEITDKTNRRIRLPKKQWEHITKTHSNMTNYLNEIKQTLENPLKIIDYSMDENVKYYYQYIKQRKSQSKYLLVIVKYLNGDGFIITAYFKKNIK